MQRAEGFVLERALVYTNNLIEILVVVSAAVHVAALIIFNPQRMRCRVTVVVLSVYVCVCLSVCYHEICCLPRFYVANKVL